MPTFGEKAHGFGSRIRRKTFLMNSVLRHFVRHSRLTSSQNDVHNVNCLLHSFSATLIIPDTNPATVISL